jgi:RNase P subunit RPR2
MTDHFEPDWDSIFQETRDGMTAWRREHPRATMREIELESERLLARLHARMVQDVAAASAAADFQAQPAESRPRCPRCDVLLVAHGKKRRALRAHGEQPVVMERTHGTCPQCGQAFFPSG